MSSVHVLYLTQMIVPQLCVVMRGHLAISLLKPDPYKASCYQSSIYIVYQYYFIYVIKYLIVKSSNNIFMLVPGQLNKLCFRANEFG